MGKKRKCDVCEKDFFNGITVTITKRVLGKRSKVTEYNFCEKDDYMVSGFLLRVDLTEKEKSNARGR